MALTDDQFARLVTAFWRTADAEQLRRFRVVYGDGLAGVPASLVDTAVGKAIEECDKMPPVAQLRRWAREAAPKPSYRFAEGLVACIGKDGKGCGEIFEMGTWCPKCYPSKKKGANPSVIWPQSAFWEVTDWEQANGREAASWYRAPTFDPATP